MNNVILCAAIKRVLEGLNTQGYSFVGHDWVPVFQEDLINELKAATKGFTWEKEKKPLGRTEADRVDILGHAPNQSYWVIEIDATRADQVAKKFLSRLALWGLRDSIDYVAILYPDTQEGKNACKKYIRYGYDVLNKINKHSSITGVFIEPTTSEIEILEYGKPCHFIVDGHSCNSMNAAAATALSLYISKHPETYSVLKNYWGHFVSDSPGGSRYKDIKMHTTDGRNVLTYTQFRRYGVSSYWDVFVKKCKLKGITITQMRKIYKGIPGSPFEFKLP